MTKYSPTVLRSPKFSVKRALNRVRLKTKRAQSTKPHLNPRLSESMSFRLMLAFIKKDYNEITTKSSISFCLAQLVQKKLSNTGHANLQTKLL